MWENVCRLHANNMPFHIRDLNVLGFGYLSAGDPRTNPPWIPRNVYYVRHLGILIVVDLVLYVQ